MQFNEFNLSTLLGLLASKKRVIIRNALIAGVAGFLIGWSIPKEYESSASIIPESSEQSSSSGLSALSSMAGIDLGNGTDAIGPDLYPVVVTSNKFIVDLLYTPVETIEGDVKTDLLTYLTEHNDEPWWGVATRAVGKAMKAIVPKPKRKASHGPDQRIDPQCLSEEEGMLIEGIKGAVYCQSDDKTGLIYVSFRSQDPLVSKIVVDTIMQHLQDFITEYRTSKARIDLQHYKLIEQETLEKYEQAQKAYADYCDTHMGNLLQAYQGEMEALETELSVAMSAYTQMKQQVQAADAKVQEQTPAFTVVELSSVPPKHCAPHKSLMAIAWCFLALIGTIGWYYVRLLFGKEQ